MRQYKLLSVLILAACTSDPSSTDQALGGPSPAPVSGGLRGAIFTTTADGARVNANIYDAQEDVYLDGGPRRPQDAALPEGDYVFEVTDPSGATLLSQDPVSCRGFHVDGNGVITAVVNLPCAHATGNDAVHGGLTVQLSPYAETPNPGGEYKVHVTTADAYATFGRFVPRYTKTDNFKIRPADEGGGSDEGSGSGGDTLGSGEGSGSDSGSGSGSCGH
jgi:hypothetical protein